MGFDFLDSGLSGFAFELATMLRTAAVRIRVPVSKPKTMPTFFRRFFWAAGEASFSPCCDWTFSRSGAGDDGAAASPPDETSPHSLGLCENDEIGWGGGHGSGETIARDVENLQRSLVQRRDGTGEPVRIEAEVAQPVQGRQILRERAGEVVVGQIEKDEAVEGHNGEGERSGKEVVIERQRFEVDESGEVGEGPEERVVPDGEYTELVEAAEGGGGDGAAEAGAGNFVAHNAALDAFHAEPLAVIEALVGGVVETVVEVGLGLERQEGDGVGRERGEGF
ncbi:protein phosphatase 2A regulatory B subunit family protein [Striga asiatica]|uniref:Protein phosphatase 2A regulatory B subunit family protein n=1 Tax=Striga asiatica TaxID=4170 RepID=A0A5A7PE04_STRAF|nr:protein phosphatase 2A regulatory B subunit family protein [Striga asiatica]